MKKLSVVFVMFLMSVVFVGCGKSISNDIKNVVQENKNAHSITEWEQSSSTPEILFAKWRIDLAETLDQAKISSLRSEVCSELNSLSGLDLSIFENEIRNLENSSLIDSCKVQLQAKIDEFYAAQKEDLQPEFGIVPVRSEISDIRFPDIVQKRDTSGGYMAITGDVGPHEVVLTFDDGPSGAYTESILDSLREVNAKAIFFELGKNVRLNPDIVKKVAADGHSIGSHTTTHACLSLTNACKRTNGHIYSFDESVKEIIGGHQAIYDVLGWVDPFFRFPYGEKSPALHAFLKANSVGEFFWNIDSEDWKAKTGKDLVARTLAQIEKNKRGVVLFHDIQRRTSEIMPIFLKQLYYRGYNIVLLKPLDDNSRYASKLVRKRIP